MQVMGDNYIENVDDQKTMSIDEVLDYLGFKYKQQVARYAKEGYIKRIRRGVYDAESVRNFHLTKAVKSKNKRKNGLQEKYERNYKNGYITFKDCARLLETSYITVYQHVKNGRLEKSSGNLVSHAEFQRFCKDENITLSKKAQTHFEYIQSVKEKPGVYFTLEAASAQFGIDTILIAKLIKDKKIKDVKTCFNKTMVSYFEMQDWNANFSKNE